MSPLAGLRAALPAAVLVTVAGLLTACGGGASSSPDAGRTPTPVATTSLPAPSKAPKPKPPPAPPLRACYRLSYAQAVAPTADRPSVPCSQPHTSLTFSIGRLRSGPTGQPLRVDSKAAQRQVSTECPRRFATFIGGTLDERHLSMLRTVWFTPTLAQGDKGARWFRCDVVALSRDDSLSTLTGPLGVRLEGVLDRADLRDRFSICGTAQPGTPGFSRVICSAAHTWRTLRTIGFAARRYPGVDAVKAAGQTPCRDAARAVAPDPLSFEWTYEWPTAAQWASGQHHGYCWAPA